MKIHTFFDPVEKLDYQRGAELIEVWKYCWSKAGWEPVVLGMADCDSLAIEEIRKRVEIKEVPTEYAVNCHLRWEAMSHIGGWMCDYDVIPIRFPPTLPTDSIMLWQHRVPCLVAGSKLAYRHVVADFLACDKLDQDMWHCQRQRYPTVDVVKTYSRPHWYAAPAIHFCNQVMQVENKLFPRHEFIPSILERLSRGDVSIRPPA